MCREHPLLWVTPFLSDLASLPPSGLSERRRGPRDLQFPGQSPGAAEKAAQSPHRLHRPSAGPAGAQLREAKIPERAGQDGTGRLPQPHRHASENVVPKQKVKMRRSLLPTAPGSRPAPSPRPRTPKPGRAFVPHNGPSLLRQDRGDVRPVPASPGAFYPKVKGRKAMPRQGGCREEWGDNPCPQPRPGGEAGPASS